MAAALWKRSAGSFARARCKIGSHAGDSSGFSVRGESYKLVAFAENDSLTRLFVPFGDLTNGGETYRGGRFLDLDRTSTGFYDLDFNKAYNPYCVYNPTYICPLPPRESRLPIPIRAGELLGAFRH